jgi:hypothetical protein
VIGRTPVRIPCKTSSYINPTHHTLCATGGQHAGRTVSNPWQQVLAGRSSGVMQLCRNLSFDLQLPYPSFATPQSDTDQCGQDARLDLLDQLRSASKKPEGVCKRLNTIAC